MSKREDDRMALIQAFKRKGLKEDSVKVARDDFRSLVRLSLIGLVTAGNMAIDQRLPECLSLFAREITRTDDGTPLRPELRKLVKGWLDDEKQAREWMDYLHRNKTKIDPYLQSFLYPLLKTLLVEKNSTPGIHNQPETAFGQGSSK